MSLALRIALKRARDLQHPALGDLNKRETPPDLSDVAAAFGCGIMVGGVATYPDGDWLAEQIDQMLDAFKELDAVEEPDALDPK